jgi:hypothetical protein
VIDVTVPVAALDEMPAELTDALVAGDHGQPGTLPRRSAVAPLRRCRTPYERLTPSSECRDSPGHFWPTRP